MLPFFMFIGIFASFTVPYDGKSVYYKNIHRKFILFPSKILILEGCLCII